MPTHRFAARLVWEKAGEGADQGNHRVELEGRPPIAISAAPQYKGDAAKANPEELLLASLTSCQMLTYLALARRAGLDVLAYEDHSEATLAMADKRMRVTEVTLHPRITIAAGGDEARARALVESAHQGCFIANSVAFPVRADAEIILEAGR